MQEELLFPYFSGPCVYKVCQNVPSAGQEEQSFAALPDWLSFWGLGGFFRVGSRLLFFFLEFLRLLIFLFLFFKWRKLLVRRRKVYKSQSAPFKYRAFSWWFSQHYWEGEDVKSPKETAVCIFSANRIAHWCSELANISFPGPLWEDVLETK